VRVIIERLRRDRALESGFTLIEVIVAITIVSIVALASAGVTITGVSAAASQEREQVAITIANGTMETVSAWSVTVNPSTLVSSLYTGRKQTDVVTAWKANENKPGVKQTYEAWDPKASSCVATSTAKCPALPIVSTPTQNGTKYSVTTLIGTCYEPAIIRSSATQNDCELAVGGVYSNPPSATPAGSTALIRVIVIVSWTAGKTCAASGCSYEATTIIDPHTDLEWVTHA